MCMCEYVCIVHMRIKLSLSFKQRLWYGGSSVRRSQIVALMICERCMPQIHSLMIFLSINVQEIIEIIDWESCIYIIK